MEDGRARDPGVRTPVADAGSRVMADDLDDDDDAVGAAPLGSAH